MKLPIYVTGKQVAIFLVGAVLGGVFVDWVNATSIKELRDYAEDRRNGEILARKVIANDDEILRLANDGFGLISDLWGTTDENNTWDNQEVLKLIPEMIKNQEALKQKVAARQELIQALTK